jgi:hypothetical protein
MQIFLNKFGSILMSRDAGREAIISLQNSLDAVSKDETVEVDFTGVNVFSPSWGDEVLGGLSKRFGDRVVLRNTTNLSVKESLELLEKIHGHKFRHV